MRAVGSTPLEAEAAFARGLPRVFWVNQGVNYEKEREGGYVRAPKKNSAGGEFSHWKRVSELKPGDLLVHHYAKLIRALGRVTAEAFVTENNEWQAAVEYFPLKEPISVEAISDYLRLIQPPSGPLTVKGTAKQGYLWDFSIEGLAFLRNHSREQWPPWADAPARDPSVQQRVAEVVATDSVSLSPVQPPSPSKQESFTAHGSDVAIMTVIPPELFAALAALGISDSQREKDAQGTVFFRGSLRSQLTGRDYRLVVTCVGGAGNYDASAAAYDVIAQHRPRVLILMGIAAGIQGKVRIGEVVLSERIVAYEPGAVVSSGNGEASTLEHRPEIDRLPHSINQDVITYRPDPSRLDARFRDLGGAIPGAPTGKEEEFRSHVASTVTVRAATIASGEKLLRDPAKLRSVRQEQHGKVEVGEMEAAGLVAACRRANIPWLVIRGISDFGDQLKDDRFHEFASRAAAVVLADFLAHGLTLQESPLIGSAALKPVPTPQYPDEQTRHLVGQLEGARARKKRLQASGANTSQVDQEILSLRRQLREGGQLRAGDRLGNYRYLLIEAIGRGGFGNIWKAYDQTTREIVAIKVLHTNLAGDTERRERFFRGARRMAELQHPAVVRVLEQQGEDGGFHYFVMEYVAGGNLRQAVLQGLITSDKIVPIILRVGEALALGHSKGIIHRDVKPANILLDEQGRPLLTDFDLVGAGDTTGGTRTGAMGTIVYAAPECLDRPQDADARADVYGLGMTALFGFHGADLPFHQIMRSHESFLAQLSCPPAIKSVLSRATSLERDERYKDAGEFLTELQRAQSASESRISVQEARIVAPRDTPFRILHLSDLHVGAGADPLSLLQPLEADLKDRYDGLGVDQLDYLVISGDITNRAAPQEFEKAREFVSALIERFGLTSERCILVPGNHDLDWDTEVYARWKKRQVDTSKLVPGTYKEDGDGYYVRDEAKYPERFKNFSQHFYYPITQRPYPLAPEEQCLSFLFSDSRLQFLAMNSAWEIDEYFTERSSISERALSRGLESANRELAEAHKRRELPEDAQVLRIAVWHHPITGNEKIQDDFFIGRLHQADIRVCLHGHVHEERAELVNYLHPRRRLYVVGAGSFGAPTYHRPESVPRLFNLLELQRDLKRLRVHTRCLRRQGGVWEGWAIWPGEQPGDKRTYYDVMLP
jgi:serine/threonine protein kinase/nucleoside phosphorylase